MKPYVSVIIPVYNEEKRIPKIKQISAYLISQRYAYEIIVVDDGSIDNTLSILKAYKIPNLQIISYKNNHGKGYAIKLGMLKAKGKYKIFTDIDLATPIAFLRKFLLKAENGYDIVIGSRKTKGARLKKRQPIIRELLGKGFTYMSRAILGMNVTDFTCGFKLYSYKASNLLFPLQTLERWGFDAEILFLSKLLNLKIAEIPVSWSNNSATKVKFPHDIIRSIWELIKIKINYMQGKYINTSKKYSEDIISLKKSYIVRKEHLFIIFTSIIVSIITFYPTFYLALFGDDWLAFYRSRLYYGEWSTGIAGSLKYLFTPYGMQDLLMGVIHAFFGFSSTPYYVISHILRILAAMALFWITIRLSSSYFSAIFVFSLFLVTSIGLDATNWVFNLPSFIAIAFLALYFFYYIYSQSPDNRKYLVLSAMFYYLAIFFAPIRMHLLPPLALTIDLIWLLTNRSINTLKHVLLRQAVMIATLMALKFSGYILGSSSETAERMTNGINLIYSSIQQGNFYILLNPFVIVGRFIIPENIWPFTATVFRSVSFSEIAVLSFAIFVPFLLYFNLTHKKISTIYLGFTIFVWTILIKLLLNNSPQYLNTHQYAGPALLGGYLILFSLFYAFSNEQKIKQLTLSCLAWMLTSFAFPYIWTPEALFGTHHRYFIASAAGFGLLLASFSLIAKTNTQKILVFFIYAFVIFIQAITTFRFFDLLVPLRGKEITQKVWGSIPYNQRIADQETPIVYYFEGNQGILYHVVTFGFPPHMSILYDIKHGGKLPVPTTDWAEVEKMVETGERLNAYGYKNEQLPIENVYAYRLGENGEMIDITNYKRDQLRLYLKQ